MIPSRKAFGAPAAGFHPPARKPSGMALQLNRLFDSREEIGPYLAVQFPDKEVKIVKVWEVKQIACVVELQDKPKDKKK